MRWRSVKIERYRMRCRQVVIMPMDVNRPAAVLMGVFMSGEDSDTVAHRRIERVVREDRHPMFMAVVMIFAVPVIVAMVIVFGKTGAVRKRWAMVVVGRAIGRMSVQERKIVTVTMTVIVAMPLCSCSMQVAPCGCGDPAAEHDQGDAGGRVEEMTKAHSDGDTS